MKTLITILVSLFSINSFAYEEAWQTFTNAVTVCPAESNPLTLMRKMGGNTFTDVKYFDIGSDGFENRVTALVVNDPKVLNPMIMRPTRLMGTIKVELTYNPPGYGLVCKVSQLR